MNALINADSLTNVLYLNFTGRGYATHAEKATVEVRVNGQLSESLRPLPPQAEGDMQCRFNISGKFSPGDVVRIDALTDDGQYHAWAEVTVPQRPNEITDIDTVTVPLTQYYYTQNYLRYKINIKDRPNENNFYRLIMDKQMTVKDYNNEIDEYVTQTTHRYHFISREDVVLTDGQPTNSDDEDNGMFDTVKNIYGVFDDSRFKNTSYTMTVYNQTNVEGLSKYGTNVKMDIIVRLLSITETEYYYLKALNLADSDAYDETCARIKLNQSSIPWFEGEMLEVVNNKIRPAASSLAISIRLTQKEDCLLDKTYSTEYQQTTKAQRFEDSPSANAACLDDMTECLSMATKEIVEEISRDIHLILSLQPKSRH
jgi:hypothetical protein